MPRPAIASFFIIHLRLTGCCYEPGAQLPAPAWGLQAPKLSHIVLRPLLSQKICAPRRADFPAYADARKTIQAARFRQKTCARRSTTDLRCATTGIGWRTFHHPDEINHALKLRDVFMHVGDAHAYASGSSPNGCRCSTTTPGSSSHDSGSMRECH